MHIVDFNSSQMPEVSVIMANFNGSRWLVDAIRSVQNQTLTDWELIIADDSSTDDSLPIMQAAAALDSRIIVLSSERNQGPSAARNRACAVARGKRVAIVDSDDILDPYRLELMVSRANIDNVAILADDLGFIDEHGALTERTLLDLTKRTIYSAIDLVTDAGRLGYLKPMFDRHIIEKISYNEQLRVGEDFDFLLRAVIRYGDVAVYPEMGYLYRERHGSLSRGSASQALEAMIVADQRFRAEHHIDNSLLAALDRRLQAMSTRLHWEYVKTCLRQRRFAKALRAILVHPRVIGHAVAPYRPR